ncbi:MAG: hypothetical protein R3Y64_00965 [Peptostreptococcaceae bacterium]
MININKAVKRPILMINLVILSLIFTCFLQSKYIDLYKGSKVVVYMMVFVPYIFLISILVLAFYIRLKRRGKNVIPLMLVCVAIIIAFASINFIEYKLTPNYYQFTSDVIVTYFDFFIIVLQHSQRLDMEI